MIRLADARVALDGGIVAVGRLDYPPDPEGVFPPAASAWLHVSRGEGLLLRPCDAARDATGFFRAERLGAVLGVPSAFVPLIRHAVAFGVEQPLDLHLPGQAGWLHSSDSTIRHEAQPLSDWHLSLREEDGAIIVGLSAALRATLPLNDWLTDTRNWWGEDAPRLVAAFTVDAATRVACLGCYIPAFEEGGDGVPAAPPGTRWPDVELATAPVGVFAMFGTDARGGWATIYTSGRTLVFSPDHDIRRLPSGFVTRGSHGWPRVWLEAVTLDTIADLLDPFASTGPLTATISLENGRFGHLAPYRDRDGPWPPIEYIVAARLAARLDAAGLRIDYRLTLAAEGQSSRSAPLEGGVTIGWEVLILRFPRFAVWRGVV